MKALWKFVLPDRGCGVVSMPSEARILKLDVQHKQSMLWAIVDPKSPRVDRFFAALPTGAHIREGWLKKMNYIDTLQEAGGGVYHYFISKKAVGTDIRLFENPTPQPKPSPTT